MLSFEPYDEETSYDEYEYLEDEVCPICDAELPGSSRPCEFCDFDPLVDNY